jgi:hypothetical protein
MSAIVGEVVTRLSTLNCRFFKENIVDFSRGFQFHFLQNMRVAVEREARIPQKLNIAAFVLLAIRRQFKR